MLYLEKIKMFNFKIKFNWFKKKNNLINWLKKKSSTIDIAEKSIYFNIDGITIRYSDHISNNSKASLNIIKINEGYLVLTDEFKLPNIFHNSDRVKIFIEDFIFIYKVYHRHLVTPLDEITYIKIENQLQQKFPEYINSKIINLFNNFDKELRNEIFDYISTNPQYIEKIINFIRKYQNATRSNKRKYWIIFTSSIEHEKSMVLQSI